MIEDYEIQKEFVKHNDSKNEKNILKEMTKNIRKAKDIDRFNDKSKFLREQKKEIGIWKTFKNNYKERFNQPIILNYKNELSKGPNQMANTFNNAFINKIKRIKESIPIGNDPMIRYMNSIKSGKMKFKFKTISLNHMNDNINSFKSTNSSGIDNLSSKLIKDQLYVLNPLITHVFNLSVLNNNYPNGLKIMKIIPALKKNKEITDPDSYRDINMSNFLSKVFDKIMYKQILKYLEENEIISSLHLRGITGMSAINAIEQLHEKLIK